MASRPNLRAVADRAGVSMATASAVVRKKTGGTIRVSEATRARVLAAADELGYQPNRAARTLRTQRSNLLGIIVPDITNPLFAVLVRAAQLQAEAHDLFTMMVDSCGEETRERRALETMLTHAVEGVVVVSNHLTVADARPFVERGTPFAATDSTLDDEGIDLVSEDLEAGARLSTEHLLSRGHTRIAHIAGDLSTESAIRRRNGFLQAMERAGLEGCVAGGSSFSPDGGRAAMDELLGGPEPPTAVYAANDMIAVGVLRSAAAHRVEVPRRLAVVGTDNVPEADVVSPPLTTVDVRPEVVARRLVDVVVSRVQGSTAPPVREIITPVLVERAST